MNVNFGETSLTDDDSPMDISDDSDDTDEPDASTDDSPMDVSEEESDLDETEAKHDGYLTDTSEDRSEKEKGPMMEDKYTSCPSSKESGADQIKGNFQTVVSSQDANIEPRIALHRGRSRLLELPRGKV